MDLATDVRLAFSSSSILAWFVSTRGKARISYENGEERERERRGGGGKRLSHKLKLDLALLWQILATYPFPLKARGLAEYKAPQSGEYQLAKEKRERAAPLLTKAYPPALLGKPAKSILIGKTGRGLLDIDGTFFSLFFFCSKMTMSVKSEPQKTAGPQECAGCGKQIQDR